MRVTRASIRWMGFSAVVLAMVTACGGDDSTAPITGDAGIADSHLVVDQSAVGPRTDASDASSIDVLACPPTPATGLIGAWAPPAAPRSVCTLAQLQSLYMACQQGTTATCRTAETNPANAECAQCVFTVRGDSRLGPLVSFTSGATWTNPGGCIALIDGDTSPSGCGAKSLAVANCLDFVCQRCTGQDWSDCIDTARDTVCATYQEAAICQRRPAYAACFESTFEDEFFSLALLFCAAGSDAGTASDASADTTRLDSGRDAIDSSDDDAVASTVPDAVSDTPLDSAEESDASPVLDAETPDSQDAQPDDVIEPDAPVEASATD